MHDRHGFVFMRQTLYSGSGIPPQYSALYSSDQIEYHLSGGSGQLWKRYVYSKEYLFLIQLCLWLILYTPNVNNHNYETKNFHVTRLFILEMPCWKT